MKDKVVLITGASSGIGKATALKFASLGAKLALNDLESKKEDLSKLKEEVKKRGGEGEVFYADVSKFSEVEEMIERIKKEFGSLDVLINNAGIVRDRTLAKMTEEEWDKVIEVNLKGVFNCSKLALPLLIASQGTIVNLSSLVGQRGNFGQTNYSASKAGIVGFTKSLAKEVGRFNVRVNAIAPGFIETPLTQNLPSEIKEMVLKLTPLQRLGKPEEVAELIVFLASDKASFIHGAVINIDGGLSI